MHRRTALQRVRGRVERLLERPGQVARRAVRRAIHPDQLEAAFRGFGTKQGWVVAGLCPDDAVGLLVAFYEGVRFRGHRRGLADQLLFQQHTSGARATLSFVRQLYDGTGARQLCIGYSFSTEAPLQRVSLWSSKLESADVWRREVAQHLAQHTHLRPGLTPNIRVEMF